METLVRHWVPRRNKCRDCLLVSFVTSMTRCCIVVFSICFRIFIIFNYDVLAASLFCNGFVTKHLKVCSRSFQNVSVRVLPYCTRVRTPLPSGRPPEQVRSFSAACSAHQLLCGRCDTACLALSAAVGAPGWLLFLLLVDSLMSTFISSHSLAFIASFFTLALASCSLHAVNSVDGHRALRVALVSPGFQHPVFIIHFYVDPKNKTQRRVDLQSVWAVRFGEDLKSKNKTRHHGK